MPAAAIPTAAHRCRAFTTAVLACLAVLAVVPHAADARMLKAIWGPVSFNGVSQFPIYHQLKVDILELDVRWNLVAPTQPANPADPNDPAYVWPPAVDDAIAQAKRDHIQLLVALLGTPPWANGGQADPTYAPTDPRQFATFAQAAARRWPYVSRWMIWIEPTRVFTFKPLFPETQRLRPLTAQQRGPVQRYAAMLDASYGAIKKVQPHDLIIGGNSFTSGDISPLNWIRNLKLPSGRRPRMDLYGHNPFAGRRPDLAKPPLGSGFADISDLDTLLGWLDRYGVRDARGHKIRVFISEFTLPTDHSNYEFDFSVDRPTQADWLRAAIATARAAKRVATFGWYTLRDQPPRPDGLEVHGGLIDANDVRKPAFQVFENARL